MSFGAGASSIRAKECIEHGRQSLGVLRRNDLRLRSPARVVLVLRGIAAAEVDFGSQNALTDRSVDPSQQGLRRAARTR